jgi:hypothetical protein
MSGKNPEDSTPGSDFPSSDLLRKLLAEVDKPRRFEVTYQVLRDPESLSLPYDLLASIGVPKESLSNTAQATLEAIEELGSREKDSVWQAFRWKLIAFLHVQDIFDATFHQTGDLYALVLFQQYYFYFESRLILAESILSGLNGLYVASHALLRPFLEFTLLQNYYYRLVNKMGTYAAIQDYLAKGRHPSWGTVQAKALPDDSFCRPIRFRLQAHLAGLSKSTLHPYHPDFSPLQHRLSVHGHSLEGIYFWHLTQVILEAALWVYYVNFPLLFHPVDILRKFGYRSPVGVVVDRDTSEIVKRSLQPSDYDAFYAYSLRQAAPTSVLNWVASRPDLTDEDIRATWDAEEYGALSDLLAGYCVQMARLRALRMAMAFRESQRKDMPEELFRHLQNLHGWKSLSSRNRKSNR